MRGRLHPRESCALAFASVFVSSILFTQVPFKPLDNTLNLANRVHIFLLARQRKVCYLTWPDTPENNAGKNAQIEFRAE